MTIGVITTHPIQYQVPLFRELTTRDNVEVSVFYERIPDAEKQGKDFGTSFSWDLPLLEGYPWSVRAGGGRQSEQAEANTFERIVKAYRNVDVMLIHGWQSTYMRRAWWKGL